MGIRVNGTHKRFRVRQATNMWWGFFQIPYDGGWIPIKSANPHFRDTKIKCLYRVERSDHDKYHLRKRGEQ